MEWYLVKLRDNFAFYLYQSICPLPTLLEKGL